jgi:HlyD family secretion protein
MNDQVQLMTATAPAKTTPAPESAPAALRRSGVRLWPFIIAALALAVAGGAWWTMRGGPSVRYVTVPAARGAIQRAVTTTGTVNPELTIIVGSYVSGVIQTLTCDYNTKVKAGQSCAKIDPRPYQTLVNQAKANLAEERAQLEKDKANLAYAKLNYARNLVLIKQDSTSKDAVDLAKNANDQAEAQVGVDAATIEQRQAELDAAQVNLDYTDIVSPVDGTVVSRNVTQGQTVASSFQTPTLFLIASDLTKMQVDANVSESDIGGVKSGDTATFTVDAFPKRVFEGVVTQVRQSPQTVQNIVTFDTVVSVANSDLALMPGMTAATRIILDQRADVLRAPNQALRYAPGGLAAAARAPAVEGAPGAEAKLWLLRDGKPIAAPVVLGLDDENYTEIVKGDLQPGDQIIVGEEHAGAASRPGLATPRL